VAAVAAPNRIEKLRHSDAILPLSAPGHSAEAMFEFDHGRGSGFVAKDLAAAGALLIPNMGGLTGSSRSG
jgi:hypothetical protein